MKRLLPFNFVIIFLLLNFSLRAQVTDIDGNVYQTVTIGTQVWMKENLKTTKYNDGTSIPNVTDNTAWGSLTTGAYCIYNNDPAIANVYGKLYNYFAVIDNRNICPTGWHVPSDTEWTILETYLGGTSIAGGRLKETGTTHWLPPNTGATNETGFTALPSGSRYYTGAFEYLYNVGHWWSSTEFSTSLAYIRGIYYNAEDLHTRAVQKPNAYTVRCLKNDLNSGLVAYYPFNGNANDESGNGINGTVTGATLSSDRFGIINKAYYFDGINDGINYGAVTIPINNFSASLWFNPKAYENSDELLYNSDGSSGFNIYLQSGYVIRFIIVASSSSSNNISLDLGSTTLNRWNNVVVTSENGVIKIFINGVLRATQTGVGGVNSLNTLHSGYDYGVNSYFFNGYLDDIRMFNRILSESEITSLYHENGYDNQTLISSFTPTSGPIGTSLTITGSGFSSTPSDNLVWFGAAKATVTAATSTQLTVTVPPGSTYQPISVTVNGLTAYSSKPFTVTFPSAQSVDASSFANKADLITGNTPTFLAIGDIDSDGKPDIAVTNQNSNTISVFRNISSSGLLTTGSFATKVDFTTAANPVGIDIGDIDGDGKPDIVVTNNGAVSVSVFQNQSTSGSISLASRIDLTTGGNPCGVAVRDFDLDGKNDIAVVNNSGSSVSIIRNISPPGLLTLASFFTKVDFPVGSGPILSAVSDYDGDGKPDIAVTNYTSNNISILKNTSTPGTIDASSFATKVDLTTGTGPYAIAAGDIDSDGKTDLVVANYNVNTVSVFRNVSTSGSITSGSFEAKVDFPATRVEFVSIGDIDGDGKPDLVVPNYNGGVVAVLKNNSVSGAINSSSFAGKVEFTTGTAPWGAGICDFDGDGKPDIVVANGQSTSISLFRNTIADTPPVPAPVIGTITHPTCTVATGSVALSGLPATGTWTLTRSPGGTTTQGTGTTTTISGLAAGTYSFTVTNASAVTSPSSSPVTINAQPVTPTTPVVGTITQPTCSVQTGSVQLSGLPSSGTWTLTRSPGNVTTQSSGVSTTISNIPVGTFTYTVTNNSGCTSAASTDVVINVAPGTPSTPTAGTIVQPTCTVPTGSVTINGLPSSGNWSLGITPGNISVTGSGTTRTITSLAPGTYTFTVTNDAGCTSLPLSGVVIQAVPIGNIPVIEKKWNSVLVCYNLNNVFTSWQWYRGNELLSTVNTKAFYNTNKLAGTYRVYATDKDGCKNYSNNIDITAGSKGVIIYPNPAGDRITLSISDESTGKAVISFYNSSGIKVLEDQTDKPDEVLLREIQVKHLEHGIYTIKITVNQKDISHNRLVISR